MTNRPASRSWPFLLLLAVLVPAFFPVWAQAGITQGYKAVGQVQIGAIVSIVKPSERTVESANPTNAARLLGVAVTPSASDLALSSADANVQIATEGVVRTLVSTAGGNVAPGDPITVSSISGVGTKATGPARVVGTATEALDDNAAEGVKRTVTEGGKTRQVTIATIKVRIAVGDFGGQKSAPDTASALLQSVASSIAGRPIAPLRAIIATLIFLCGLTSTTVLLYSAVRNSIIAIGRNPLARSAVYRSLAQVSVLALALLLVASGIAYGILR